MKGNIKMSGNMKYNRTEEKQKKYITPRKVSTHNNDSVTLDNRYQ